jgi:hypothetical protein
MTKRGKIIFIMLVLLLMHCYSTTAFPATYYIDYASGSDTNNGKSTSTPWKHCPGMKGFIGSHSHSNGDIFVFKGGVTWFAPVDQILIVGYSGTVGSEDKYVGGQRCGQTGSPACNGGVTWGSGYPVFNGNAVGNAVLMVYARGKSNLVFDGIKFYNVGKIPTDPTGQGLFIDSGSNIEVKNCLFEVLSMNAFSYGIDSGSSSKIYFHDNYVKRSGRIPIQPGRDAFIDDIQIYNNLFEGPADLDPGPFHTDGLMIGGEGTSRYSITNLKIHHNKWFGDWSKGGTAMIYINGRRGFYSTQHVEIYNNVIAFENNNWYGGTRPNISPALIDISFRHDDIKIYNNTLSADAITSPTPVSSCIILGYDNVSNIVIKNNILSGCWAGVTIGSEVKSTPTIDYNLYNTAEGDHLIVAQGIVRCDNTADCHSSPLTYEQHGIKANPKFVTLPSGGVTGSGNWHLQSSSPARTGGANLGTPYTTDLDGIFGTGYIGAYKYSTTHSSLAGW